MFIVVAIAILIGAISGFGGAFLLRRVVDQARLRVAQEEAEDMLKDAKDAATELMAEAKSRIDDYEEQLTEENKKDIAALEAKVEARQASYRNKRSAGDRQHNQNLKEMQKRQEAIDQRDQDVEKRQNNHVQKKNEILELRAKWMQKLQEVCGLDTNKWTEQHLQDFETHLHTETRKRLTREEEETRIEAEQIAKRILSNALSRFPRESSTERGLGIIEIPSEDAKAKILANESAILARIAEVCGVDITINEHNSFAVAGFDPVRRELATRTLEKLMTEKFITLQVVDRIVEKTRKDLFSRIEQDGKRIATELGMQDLHPEIKNMLGCLRYRYSFAQNQLHHVGEVGWLCGLLANELGGVDSFSARRSGLLHDIGKAMDHSIDGGHAVIGADFIQKLGEKDHIVHAVKSHHYEEQPSTDLAFLVIAADAISGARPGARRSTMTAYNQKIEALSQIADGFPGVHRTLIFNAGREVRVLVDAHKVNDEQSLKLCRDIADRIEDECSYPGQIRVVVVRESHAEAVAK